MQRFLLQDHQSTMIDSTEMSCYYVPCTSESVYINTEMLFALFDLLGLQFAPRIRDLGEQRLYRMDRTKTYQHIEPLLKGVINQELITNAWDDLLRVAGSLKRGWVTSSLFISRMQAYPRTRFAGIWPPGEDPLHLALSGK